jgi:hypothetical protein
MRRKEQPTRSWPDLAISSSETLDALFVVYEEICRMQVRPELCCFIEVRAFEDADNLSSQFLDAPCAGSDWALPFL